MREPTHEPHASARRPRILDPIVLFVVLGAALVGLHVLTRTPSEPETARTIVVTDADVRLIHEAFARRRMRPPTPSELRGLVDRHVRDEMLYREAVALGLDREDAALRRRLATQLELLAKDVGAAAEPTDADLQAYFEKHVERYAIDPKRAFQQVYFSLESRGERAVADARDLLVELGKTEAPDVSEAGDPTLLAGEYAPSSEGDVRRDFGPEFAAALFELEVDRWSGPIASSYGLHVVRVLSVVPGETPPLASVRNRVRADLLSGRQEEALDAYLAALSKRYAVEMRATLPGANER